MKSRANVSTLLSWPHGFLIEECEAGLLLKPRAKPRAGWSSAFRKPASARDETAPLRSIKNNFDEAEWKW